MSVNLAQVYFLGQSLLGSTMGKRDELRTVLSMMERGELKPIVDRVFPLEELGKAHDYLEAQSQIGKVVISMEEVAS